MILKSYENIDGKVDYLNAINVFPVPDGDTGLNIYATMTAIVEELRKSDNTSQTLTIKEASRAIAKGAFIGAKGNSGVILSQFFVGFAKSIENEEEVDTLKFAQALVEGSKRSYKAVMNPREGTILTVVRETADAAIKKAESGASWKQVVEHCYNIAQNATLDTPNLMEELKKADVVDAGALGFVYLIQGWLFVIANTFDGPRVFDIRAELEGLENKVNINHTLDDLTYEYCTEAMVILHTADEAKIRSQLANQGDSLLLIENDNEMKMHIHTGHPSQVITKFSKFGQLQAVKIDDMRSQTLLTH